MRRYRVDGKEEKGAARVFKFSRVKVSLFFDLILNLMELRSIMLNLNIKNTLILTFKNSLILKIVNA